MTAPRAPANRAEVVEMMAHALDLNDVHPYERMAAAALAALEVAGVRRLDAASPADGRRAMSARVEPPTTLVEAFKRNLAEAYQCLDLPDHFQDEGSIFRIGWVNHALGLPCPKRFIHARRGWMERENMKRQERADV